MLTPHRDSYSDLYEVRGNRASFSSDLAGPVFMNVPRGNIILARDDYDLAYKQFREEGDQKVLQTSPHRKILWTLLTTRCLVFIGFSLFATSKPYARSVLDILGTDALIQSSFILLVMT